MQSVAAAASRPLHKTSYREKIRSTAIATGPSSEKCQHVLQPGNPLSLRVLVTAAVNGHDCASRCIMPQKVGRQLASSLLARLLREALRGCIPVHPSRGGSPKQCHGRLSLNPRETTNTDALGPSAVFCDSFDFTHKQEPLGLVPGTKERP